MSACNTEDQTTRWTWGLFRYTDGKGRNTCIEAYRIHLGEQIDKNRETKQRDKSFKLLQKLESYICVVFWLIKLLCKQWANNPAADWIQYTKLYRRRDENGFHYCFHSPPSVLQSVYLPSLSASVSQCVCLESQCQSRQGLVPEKTKVQRSVNISATSLKDHVQLDTLTSCHQRGSKNNEVQIHTCLCT